MYTSNYLSIQFSSFLAIFLSNYLAIYQPTICLSNYTPIQLLHIHSAVYLSCYPGCSINWASWSSLSSSSFLTNETVLFSSMFTLTKVPPNAVLGGTTAEGSKLYICKARDQDPDQWKIGHYDPANSKYCFVHHGVDEAKFADFFVLAISETSAYRFFKQLLTPPPHFNSKKKTAK